MITYKQISTREDRLFLMKCKQMLGVRKFNELVPSARLAFELAYKNETNEVKRENSARRAVNLVYTNAVKELNK